MITDNDNKKPSSADPSYGGSKYRLSYDELGNGQKKRKRISDKTRTLIIIVAVICLFAAFTVLALEHFGDELKKIYDPDDESSETLGEAEFQSSINVVID